MTELMCILTSGQEQQMNIKLVAELIYSFFSVNQLLLFITNKRNNTI